MSSINLSDDNKKVINQNEKDKKENCQLNNNDKIYVNLESIIQNQNNYNNIKGVIYALFNYQIDSLQSIDRIERDFKTIGEKYTKRLPFNYIERLDKLKEAIMQNYTFLFKIAEPYKGLFKIYKYPSGESYLERLEVNSNNIIQIRSSLFLFIRDWSIEGKEERDSTYKLILEELKLFFKNKTKNDYEKGINILIPEAGLGRLVYEIAKLGFKVHGNEFSFFMLLYCNFLFTNNIKKNDITIQPFIHILSNLFNFESAFRKLLIPDENIKEELLKSETGSLYMEGGDFISTYKNKLNFYDSIVTCFFIDTAYNIIEYIETIYNTLKVGGIWINIGPLLYHHTSDPNAVSIELGWNDIKEIIIGFDFEKKKKKIVETTYSSDKESMMKKVYRCIFFTAVKKK